MTWQSLATLILVVLGTIQAEVVNVAITENGVHATVSVGVGSPPTQYSLLIDTGSSNTWVGANKTNPYVRTTTSTDTGNTVSVSYGSGNFTGEEFIDVFKVGTFVVPRQSIGVASNSTGFDGVDGIFGLGPTGLTNGTVNNTGVFPTVVDNLFSGGQITLNQFAIYFEPSSKLTDNVGEITFGGVDSTKYTGEINYTPITTISPSRDFWGFNASFQYDGTNVLSSTNGIIDTGTSLLYLATEGFNTIQKLTGGVPDSATGLLSITEDQYRNLKPLLFIIDKITYTITPNALIWPRALNTAIGGNADKIYLIVFETKQDPTSKAKKEPDFTLGYTVLQRFYTVHDIENKRIGFATTPFTNANTN